MKAVNNFLGNNINKTNKMAYKMKGFSGFKSPAKQKKVKNKAKLQGPIPEQNIG